MFSPDVCKELELETLKHFYSIAGFMYHTIRVYRTTLFQLSSRCLMLEQLFLIHEKMIAAKIFTKFVHSREIKPTIVFKYLNASTTLPAL